MKVFCNGMSNFGARFADPCGWIGPVADAQYILDERRCPKCGGELRKVDPKATSTPGATP